MKVKNKGNKHDGKLSSSLKLHDSETTIKQKTNCVLEPMDITQQDNVRNNLNKHKLVENNSKQISNMEFTINPSKSAQNEVHNLINTEKTENRNILPLSYTNNQVENMSISSCDDSEKIIFMGTSRNVDELESVIDKSKHSDSSNFFVQLAVSEGSENNINENDDIIRCSNVMIPKENIQLNQNIIVKSSTVNHIPPLLTQFINCINKFNLTSNIKHNIDIDVLKDVFKKVDEHKRKYPKPEYK